MRVAGSVLIRRTLITWRVVMKGTEIELQDLDVRTTGST